MWVIADKTLAYVYAAGSRMVSTGPLGGVADAPIMFESQRACVRLTVSTDTPGFAEARVEIDDCAAYVTVVLPAHHTNVCVDAGSDPAAAACGTIMVSMFSTVPVLSMCGVRLYCGIYAYAYVQRESAVKLIDIPHSNCPSATAATCAS